VISGISVSAETTGATIAWQTDEPTTGSVAYGETSAYELGSATSTTPATSHSVTLSGLDPDTLHYYQIAATDDAGYATVSAQMNFSTISDSSGSDPSGIVSDDFHQSALNTGLWTFIDPVGDGSYSTNGTQLLLSVPAGTSHDVWKEGNLAPRVMQSASDTDFELEVKFETGVSEQYQLQGLIVEESEGNFLRFDFYSTGGPARVFAASFTNGSPNAIKYTKTSLSSSPLYMRVSRSGDQWTQQYSSDGVNWETNISFAFSMTVTQVGVFAGNAGPSPAHTAAVDYFFNTAAPIDPEDGGGSLPEYTLAVDVSGMGSVTISPDQAAYASGQSVTLTVVPDAGCQFDGWSGDVAGSTNPVTITMDDDKSVTAAFGN
jgi:regulation of enolase protein 1 (concanavalin A-like superfamily)